MSQDYNHHLHQPPPPQQQSQPQPHVSSNIFAYNPNAGFDNRSADDQSTTTEDQSAGGMNPAAYESAGMLSEMFNFGHGPGANTGGGPPPELLDYRRAGVGDLGGTQDWYGPRQIGQQQQRHEIGDHHHQQQQHHHDHNDAPPHHHHHQHHQQQHHQMGGAINAHNSVDAGSMQLFLTNAPPRSPSPPPPPPSIQVSGCGGGFHTIQGVVHHHSPTSTTTNNNNNNNNNLNFWATHPHAHPHHHMNSNPGELGGMVEVQGLSLSLSSSLQHLEAAKQVAEDNHIMFFNQPAGVGPSSTATNTSSPTHFFKNLMTTPGPQAQHPVILHSLQPVGGFVGPSTTNVGFGSSASTSASLGLVNVLRNSKYAKPAQELLEEFCSVGRGQLKKPNLGRQNSSNNPNSATSGGGGGGGATAGSSSSPRDSPQLSPADRIEHQRRKVKLLAMLDEVDRRYNHYCEQMQTVVNSFDLVMGYGAAIPYTALAQKAMSRHFRCLKDAVHAQLKHSCELLGEKDPTASSGLTKGETPRLKVLEQSLRQQRAFHQMGMMDQEAWRPQRGLPERSVNILRAWLFEHFLHPYPSDADKHLLARQTGLSRNQVSNWFINARVRLWKPMVEEMYQQEAKDREDDDDNDDDDHDRDEEIRSGNQTSSSTSNNNTNNSFPTTQQQQQQNCAVAQNPMPSSSATTSATTTTMLTEGKRSADTMHPTPPDCDPSLLAINRHHHHQQQQQQQQQIQFQPPSQPPSQHAGASGLPTVSQQAFLQGVDKGVDNTCHFGSDDGPDNVGGPTTMIRFGAAAGDVSLTLGLRHSGNAPDQKSAPFPVRDYGSF